MRVACAGRLGSFTVRQSSCRASGVASVVKHASSATTSPAPCWCGAVWLRLRDRPPDLSTQVKHEVPSALLREQISTSKKVERCWRQHKVRENRPFHNSS